MVSPFIKNESKNWAENVIVFYTAKPILDVYPRRCNSSNNIAGYYK